MVPPPVVSEEAMPCRALPVLGRESVLFHPLAVTGATVALALGTRWAVDWNFPFPQCLMRKWTGLPCPTCGCTRSLLAWSHLDLEGAFRFNPLFSGLIICLGLWVVFWGLERLKPRRWTGWLRRMWTGMPTGKILLALLGVNWVYLYFKLPR